VEATQTIERDRSDTTESSAGERLRNLNRAQDGFREREAGFRSSLEEMEGRYRGDREIMSILHAAEDESRRYQKQVERICEDAAQDLYQQAQAEERAKEAGGEQPEGAPQIEETNEEGRTPHELED
jgi:hypothetical protein